MSSRRLILVLGVYRSGTSLLAGILGQVGCHIPQPELRADDTNPRGFGEPRWVVEFHERLMAAALITVNDSRPAAWKTTRKVASRDAAYAQLREWLAPHLERDEPVVVKDPRTVWFLPLWTRCAADLGVETSFVTTLRHPAETLASARKAYGKWQTDASRATAWVNLILEIERTTRDTSRTFVRYEDLLGDWPRELHRVGEAIALPELVAVERESHPQVDGFVDPTLYRNRTRWDGLDVPSAVREMAEDVWSRVQPLTAPAGDTATLRTELDDIHAAYDSLYAEAEAISQSSVTMEVLRARFSRPPPPLWRRAARRAKRTVTRR